MLDALIKDNVIVDELIREKIKLLNDEITFNNVYNDNDSCHNVIFFPFIIIFLEIYLY